MELTIYHRLAIALGMGLIVGLQREWVQKRVAGIRTFTLITVLGGLCAALAEVYSGWILAAGFIGVAGFLLMSNFREMKSGTEGMGITSEIAALLMFIVGATIVGGETAVGVVVGGAVAVLLQWKQPLHNLVRQIGEEDFQAITRLVLVGLVILPVLPDQDYGPYHVLNPFRIWLMVVLIVGISMAAYLAQRLLGERVGTLLAGVLGGLISSTATTVSYARQVRRRPGSYQLAAIVLILASTIVFGRVMFEISVVASDILPQTAPPIVAMMAFMAVVAGLTLVFTRKPEATETEKAHPPDLKAAVIFGVLYAIVLLAVAVAKDHFGDEGLYVVSAISGLTDMDAITLSTAQLVKSDRIDVDLAWRLILVGSMSNLVFKAAIVGLVGTRQLFLRILLLFGLSLAGGVLILFLWP